MVWVFAIKILMVRYTVSKISRYFENLAATSSVEHLGNFSLWTVEIHKNSLITFLHGRRRRHFPVRYSQMDSLIPIVPIRIFSYQASPRKTPNRRSKSCYQRYELSKQYAPSFSRLPSSILNPNLTTQNLIPWQP